MPNIFAKIIRGEVPAYKVAETKDYLAFLDIQPVQLGHTLCIPKAAVDYLYDMDDESYMGLWLFSKAVAKAVKQAVPCTKVGTAVVGLEVAHAHIHLIPINTISEMDFTKPRQKVSEQQMAELAKKIHSFI